MNRWQRWVGLPGMSLRGRWYAFLYSLGISMYRWWFGDKRTRDLIEQIQRERRKPPQNGDKPEPGGSL